MSKKDSGQAFPSGTFRYSGMTLRDYFAGQALIELVSRYYDSKMAAKMAYIYANAMLKEREKEDA